MNLTFIVTFKGLSEHGVAAVEKMLREDIAGYPDRVSMESARVNAPRAARVAAPPSDKPVRMSYTTGATNGKS